jgi:prepilin-type N-terminal cleavage/methylation domain-containing protein
MARHRRNDREDGFTLIELLLTVSIGGLLAVALMTTVAVSFQAADSTSARFEESQDAQIAAAYFAADVAGSNRIAATACGVPPPSATIVDLEAVDGSIVSYERVVEHARPQLVRRSCDPAGQIINETTMSHHLGDHHGCCVDHGCSVGGRAFRDPQQRLQGGDDERRECHHRSR